MTPIEVYTINKETVMCHDANYYQCASFDTDKFYTNRLGEPCEALVQNHAWKIKKFTDCFEKRDGTRSYLDTYITIDPKLEKLLTTELKQQYDARVVRLEDNLNLAMSALSELETTVKQFKSLPWYKRIWMVIKNEI